MWERLIFGLQPPRVVTIIGGGGKTSLMYYLLHRLKAAGYSAIATTTTKLSSQQRSDHYFITIKSIKDGCYAVEQVQGVREDATLVYGEDSKDQGKLVGIPRVWIDELAAQYKDTVFIVEGDGAAGKALKGHLSHEPVIPADSHLVIAVIGIDSIALELNTGSVHRPDRICELTGARRDSLVTMDVIVQLLFHEKGYLHNCPEDSEILPFINKVESIEQQKHAENLASRILAYKHPQISRVIVGSVLKEEFQEYT